MNAKKQAETEPENLPEPLKRALQESYFPLEKGRVTSPVMEQIRCEKRLQLDEKRNARRRRNGLWMKYGGLAACMIILSGALALASPKLGGDVNLLLSPGTDEAEILLAECCEAAAPEATAEFAQEMVLSDVLVSEGSDNSAGDNSAGDISVGDISVGENSVGDISVGDTDAGDFAEDSDEVILTFSAPAACSSPQTETEEEILYKSFVQKALPEDDQALYQDTASEKSEAAVEGFTHAQQLQAWLDAGLLTEDEYQSWMTRMGYTSPEDWTLDEITAALEITCIGVPLMP